MTTAAPPLGDLLNRDGDAITTDIRTLENASRPVLPIAPRQSVARVIVLNASGSSQVMSTTVTATTLTEPAAVIVVASDGEPHPELWPQPAVPVLVVLPPHAPLAAVVAAFRAGADACVSTASSAEVTAHLGALLRRNALRVNRA